MWQIPDVTKTFLSLERLLGAASMIVLEYLLIIETLMIMRLIRIYLLRICLNTFRGQWSLYCSTFEHFIPEIRIENLLFI